MQRYFAISKEKDYLFLKKEDIHHIRNVMRNKIGDKIECIYEEELYICKIENPNSQQVKITEQIEEHNELNTNIAIAIALVKEQKMDLILQKVTELGVNEIIPIKMERSIVKLDDNKWKKKQERWQTICKEASEQSKRNKIPQIKPLTTIEELAKLKYDKKLICSTNEKSKRLSEVLKEPLNNKNILLIIGPEGGITPKEEEFLISSGMTPITLGNRIMRVETAAIYVTSILNFYSME